MAEWLAANWFTSLQAAGIAGGLLLNVAVLRMDLRVRRTEVMLSLTEAHRDIWEKLIEQPALNRILAPEANVHAQPPTPEERRFVQLVIHHLATVRQAVKEKAYDASPGMDQDIREFLALPIPRVVVDGMLPYQAPDFQEYLHGLMDR
jgi:hypothetical protein